MLSLLLAASALQALPQLESELWIGRLEPKWAQGKRAQQEFREAISKSQWEKAFVAGGQVIDSMGCEPYIWVQNDWKRYELLFLADRIDLVIAHCRKEMMPLGTFKGIVIRRPADYHELLQQHTDELYKSLGDKYMTWCWSYYEAAKHLELASVLNGDFIAAVTAIEEQEKIPQTCGTGKQPIVFGWAARKEIWKAALKDSKRLSSLVRGGFTPIPEPSLDDEWQIRYVSTYGLLAEACLARGQDRQDAFQRLLIKLEESQAVNQEIFLLRLAHERSR